MLERHRVHCALALATAATAAAVGCGGGVDTTTGGGGSGGHPSTASSSASSSAASSSVASSSSGAPVCPPGEGTVLAVTKLAFGEGNSGQWKKVGFNIDGLTSTGTSTDVCKPNSMGDPATAYPDGDNGIDNSFGKNLLPIILALSPTWSTDVNSSIDQGFFTALLKLYCLPPTGDMPVMTTKLFGGTMLGMKPKWDGTDQWPVVPELLSDPMNPESSTITFQNSSVTGTTFDSGKNQVFILTVPVSVGNTSTSLKLTLRSAQTTMTLSADRLSATGGMIGGVLDTEELVVEVKKIGYLLNLCSSSFFPPIIQQIRQASDIMNDGSQDTTQTCNGISMGLTFEMGQSQLGKVGMPQQVGMACP